MPVENLFSKGNYGTQKERVFSPFLCILFSCTRSCFARMPPAGFRVFEVGLPKAMSVSSNPSDTYFAK